MAKKVIKSSHPKNVGIIMDGNGRWALKNSFQISEGHKKGVQIVRQIVEESVEQNISSLTLYAFSSENWQRPKTEVNAIKKLIIDAINEQLDELKEQHVMVRFFGHVEDFGEKVLRKIQYAEAETKRSDQKLKLNIALSYGGQQDILDIVKQVSKKVSEKKINIDEINHKIINQYSCAPVDRIDLLIRTGGDKRISNFLLYQIAYAEIIFVERLWPDFSKKDYLDCLIEFGNASRRFGKRV